MSLIFTNHSRERMRKRRITDADVSLVLKHPDQTFPGKKEGTVKFIREVDGRAHHVVAKLLENKRDWLVLSVWVRGEDDFNWVEWTILAPFKLLFWILKLLMGK